MREDELINLPLNPMEKQQNTLVKSQQLSVLFPCIFFFSLLLSPLELKNPTTVFQKSCQLRQI